MEDRLSILYSLRSILTHFSNATVPPASLTPDRIRGTLLGTAVGDALGMPVEGLSHQNVRTYYKGIKGYTADIQRRDLDAGQWTDDTQLTFAVARALTAVLQERDRVLGSQVAEAAARHYVDLRAQPRRWGPTTRAAVDRLAEGAEPEDAGEDETPTNGAAMRAAPLGAWWAATDASKEDAWAVVAPVLRVTHRHPASLAAGFGQAFAVRQALRLTPDAFDRAAFWKALCAMTAWAEERLAQEAGEEPDPRVSDRLRRLTDHLRDFPLDLQDLCDGTGTYADEAWPFAAAMFARNPGLLEATLLSAINVGGDADTVGAMTGALLGALHGWSAFPQEWRDGLEQVETLEAEAAAFADAVLGPT